MKDLTDWSDVFYNSVYFIYWIIFKKANTKNLNISSILCNSISKSDRTLTHTYSYLHVRTLSFGHTHTHTRTLIITSASEYLIKTKVACVTDTKVWGCKESQTYPPLPQTAQLLRCAPKYCYYHFYFALGGTATPISWGKIPLHV